MDSRPGTPHGLPVRSARYLFSPHKLPARRDSLTQRAGIRNIGYPLHPVNKTFYSLCIHAFRKQGTRLSPTWHHFAMFCSGVALWKAIHLPFTPGIFNQNAQLIRQNISAIDF